MEQVRTFTSSVLEPYERGAEFGQRHRSEIARTVASYRRLFSATATRPFDVELWSGRAWRSICALAPRAAHEIRGIADGAGVPVSEIAALNARTELLAIANPTGVDECSTVVSVHGGRAPVAVQTWDWYDAMSRDWLHWTIPYPNGRVVETVTEYGVLGKIGICSDGVGVLFNMLHHANDGADLLGFPVHLLSRHILESAHDVGEAVAAATSVAASASTSLTVVDAAGGAVSVELFPGGSGVVKPERELLVRTNHFLSDEGRQGCLASAIGAGSEMRRATILAALEDRAPVSAREIIDAMHHHAEIGGVCGHPDLRTEPVLRHATLAMVVIDPGEPSLQVSAGGPCRLLRPSSLEPSTLRPSSRP